MLQHREPRNRLPGSAYFFWHRDVGNALEETQADDAVDAANQKNRGKLPIAGMIPEHRSRDKKRRAARHPNERLVEREVLPADRIRHERGDPRKPRATGDASEQIK